MDEQSSTCRGIRLGSQKGDVQSAYAAYSADFDGSTVTLTSDDDYSLSFLFDNDKLVGILSFSKEKNILHNNDLNEGKKNIEPKQGELSDEEFDIYSRYGNPVSPLAKASDGYLYTASPDCQSKRGMLIHHNTYEDILSAYHDSPSHVRILSDSQIAVLSDYAVLIFLCDPSTGILQSITSQTVERYKKGLFVSEITRYGSHASDAMQTWADTLSPEENDLLAVLHNHATNSFYNLTDTFSVDSIEGSANVTDKASDDQKSYDASTPSEATETHDSIYSSIADISWLSEAEKTGLVQLLDNFFKNYNFPIFDK